MRVNDVSHTYQTAQDLIDDNNWIKEVFVKLQPSNFCAWKLMK